MFNLEELRNGTLVDALTKLRYYGKCCVVRPTGFGKTHMVPDLLERYNNVLYLYPVDCLKQVVHGYLQGKDGITFMSYSKVARLKPSEIQEILSEDYDLIVADECHRIGANNTSKKLKSILKEYKGHFIGMTATPDRMDSYDVVNDFFSGVVVFPYTLHDAFEDGSIKRPYYIYCTADVKAELLEEGNRVGLTDNEVNMVIKKRYVELAALFNVQNILRRTVEEHVKRKDYMKFICFFSKSKQMDAKYDTVVSWFKEAFPNHKVNVLIIRSDKAEYRENLNFLGDLVPRSNVIDLIFCIDMLNLGYHVDDLTGIFMYRGTDSGIIYTQQLGRALSTGSTEAAIVIDVVDNLHRKSLYYEIAQMGERYVDKVISDIKADGRKEGLTEEEIQAKVDEYIEAKRDEWWHQANDITSTDLIMEDVLAKQHELIEKVCQEPITQRCKECYDEWVERGGIPEPRTVENWSNEDGNERVPLPVICMVHRVSVNDMLRWGEIVD